MSENFCLEWNEHNAQFFKNAEKLKKTETLTDVTITCGALPHVYSAHKLILASGSGYFARIFSNTFRGPSAGVVHLKDIEPRHMELLLNYMYRGQITCTENDLNGLLEAARGLQIRGLTDHGVQEPPEQEHVRKKKYVSPKKTISINTGQKKRKNDGEEGTSESENDENEQPDDGKQKKKVKREMEVEIQMEEEDGTVETYGGTGEEDDYQLEYEDPEATVENILNPKQCPDCMKVFFSRQVMKRHYRSVHAKETPFACWECSYVTSRKTTLGSHMIKTHGIKKEDYKKKVDEMYKYIKVNDKKEWVQVQNA